MTFFKKLIHQLSWSFDCPITLKGSYFYVFIAFCNRFHKAAMSFLNGCRAFESCDLHDFISIIDLRYDKLCHIAAYGNIVSTNESGVLLRLGHPVIKNDRNTFIIGPLNSWSHRFGVAWRDDKQVNAVGHHRIYLRHLPSAVVLSRGKDDINITILVLSDFDFTVGFLSPSIIAALRDTNAIAVLLA